MRAVVLRGHGESPQVVEVGPPAPGDPGEVVLDMIAAAVNPLDRLVLLGKVAPDAPVPRTLGVEGVGRVGPQRYVVHGYGVGLTRDGTFAERVLAPRAALVPVPDEVSDDQAALASVSLATAVRVAQYPASVRGEHALVLGAAGNVGRAVCSLLTDSGVRTSGQTGDPAKADLIAATGAVPIIASDAGRLAGQASGPYDVIVDSLGGAWTRAAIELAGYGARMVVFGASAGPEIALDVTALYRRGLTLRGYGGVFEPPERLREAAAQALSLVAAGRLALEVGSRFSLGDAAAAFAALSTRKPGKILLDIQS